MIMSVTSQNPLNLSFWDPRLGNSDTCDDCEQWNETHSQACFRCKMCMLFLCDACAQKHLLRKETQRHTLAPMSYQRHYRDINGDNGTSLYNHDQKPPLQRSRSASVTGLYPSLDSFRVAVDGTNVEKPVRRKLSMDATFGTFDYQNLHSPTAHKPRAMDASFGLVSYPKIPSPSQYNANGNFFKPISEVPEYRPTSAGQNHTRPPQRKLTASMVGDLDPGTKDIATACCFLPNGTIAIIKETARKISLVSLTSMAAYVETTLPVRPFGVTTIRSGVWAHLLLAISADDKQIYMFHVDENNLRLILKTKVFTDRQYAAVAGIPNNLIVAISVEHPVTVDIIDNQHGHVMRSFSNREFTILSPCHVSAVGNRLIIADNKLDSLTCVSPRGEVLFTCRLPVEERPLVGGAASSKQMGNSNVYSVPYQTFRFSGLQGVAVYRSRGNKEYILGAGGDRNKVFVWDAKGRFQRTLTIGNSDLVGPLSLAVRDDGMLAVTQIDGRVRLLQITQDNDNL